MNGSERVLKCLWELFWLFTKMGFMTFGGGATMLPILQRELLDKRQWVTEEELVDYYAIGQCTPGIIAVNLSTFIGKKRAGDIGGVVATAGFAMLMTNPYVFLICLVLFVLIVLMSKFVSLGSVMTMLIYPFILYGVDNFVLGGCPYVAYALIIAVLVIFKHKDNIKRLREGTERKFSLKSNKKESDAEPKERQYIQEKIRSIYAS